MEHPALFLLQTVGLLDFKIQPEPIQGIIFAVGVVGIVVLIVYLNKSKKIKNNPVFQTGTIDKEELGALAVKGMVKIARKYGLNAAEQKVLAKASRKAGLDVSSLFHSPDDIDAGFSRMVSALGREDDTGQAVAKLFSIRNKVEYYVSANEKTDAASGKTGILRRYRRVHTDMPASFYLVFVTEAWQGLKKVKKLSLDTNKLLGKVLDVSAGGCAISTRASVKAGARIKIEFKIGKGSFAALAIILRVNKDRAENVLHTRFIKVPVKTLNAINALAYNYRDI